MQLSPSLTPTLGTSKYHERSWMLSPWPCYSTLANPSSSSENPCKSRARKTLSKVREEFDSRLHKETRTGGRIVKTTEDFYLRRSHAGQWVMFGLPSRSSHRRQLEARETWVMDFRGHLEGSHGIGGHWRQAICTWIPG